MTNATNPLDEDIIELTDVVIVGTSNKAGQKTAQVAPNAMPSMQEDMSTDDILDSMLEEFPNNNATNNADSLENGLNVHGLDGLLQSMGLDEEQNQENMQPTTAPNMDAQNGDDMFNEDFFNTNTAASPEPINLMDAFAEDDFNSFDSAQNTHQQDFSLENAFQDPLQNDMQDNLQNTLDQDLSQNQAYTNNDLGTNLEQALNEDDFGLADDISDIVDPNSTFDAKQEGMQDEIMQGMDFNAQNTSLDNPLDEFSAENFASDNQEVYNEFPNPLANSEEFPSAPTPVSEDFPEFPSTSEDSYVSNGFPENNLQNETFENDNSSDNANLSPNEFTNQGDMGNDVSANTFEQDNFSEGFEIEDVQKVQDMHDNSFDISQGDTMPEAMNAMSANLMDADVMDTIESDSYFDSQNSNISVADALDPTALDADFENEFDMQSMDTAKMNSMPITKDVSALEDLPIDNISIEDISLEEMQFNLDENATQATDAHPQDLFLQEQDEFAQSDFSKNLEPLENPVQDTLDDLEIEEFAKNTGFENFDAQANTFGIERDSSAQAQDLERLPEDGLEASLDRLDDPMLFDTSSAVERVSILEEKLDSFNANTTERLEILQSSVDTLSSQVTSIEEHINAPQTYSSVSTALQEGMSVSNPDTVDIADTIDVVEKENISVSFIANLENKVQTLETRIVKLEELFSEQSMLNDRLSLALDADENMQLLNNENSSGQLTTSEQSAGAELTAMRENMAHVMSRMQALEENMEKSVALTAAKVLKEEIIPLLTAE